MNRNGFKPDFRRLKKVLLREGEPDTVPFYDLFADKEIIEAIVGKPLSRETAIEFQVMMGYDYVNAGIGYGYSKHVLTTDDVAPLSRGKRTYIDDNHGEIENRADFNAYKWPTVTDAVATGVIEVSRLLPDGMKVILGMPGGILENVMWLMGYIPMSYAIYDDEQLIYDLFEKIGRDYTRALQLSLELADIGKIGAVVMGDDMGYNTSTMFSPELLRKYVFPWQKKIVEITHSFDLPFILHSCGNLEAIMDDLIDDVGIDAKQSFEDNIMPVSQAKKKYGHRIAILGGADVHSLTALNEEQVRTYVGKIIEDCAPGGGYALGTGNTVANYIPVTNFLAMLDVGRKKGKYPIRRGE